MTDSLILPLGEQNKADLNRCDNSFIVEAELCPRAECVPGADGRTRSTAITYTVRGVSPYTKRYGYESYDADEYLRDADRGAWLAYMDGQLAGQIVVRQNWNRMAVIGDVAVNPSFRRRGAGRQLIGRAVEWARSRGLAGVMLETQNINVPACCLYENCGFTLGGFDRYLYQGEMPGTEEIALFWYLLFGVKEDHNA